MNIEFLPWKEILPFIKTDSTKKYPPFRSPFLYIYSKRMLFLAKGFGKLITFVGKIAKLLNFKIWKKITLASVLFFLFSVGLALYFIFNAKVAHDMGINGAVLAIPGVTLPMISLVGLLVAVFIHEMGHGGAMIEEGYPPKDVGLLLLLFIPVGAGVRPCDEAEKASPEARANIFSAGVVMNFIGTILIFPFFIWAQQVLWSNFWTLIFFWIFVFNLGLGIFNFLAIPPLDGYYIYQALAEKSISDPIKRKVFMGSIVGFSIFLLLLNFGLFGLFVR